jgi:S-adenosylmethionine decarboxylase related protein
VGFRLSGAQCDTLDDLEAVERALRRVADAAALTPVASVHHRFQPQGISAVLVLAESHIAIHTWPEERTAHVTLTSCRDLPADTIVSVSRLLKGDLGAGTVVSGTVVV